jgi:hypothetical protein
MTSDLTKSSNHNAAFNEYHFLIGCFSSKSTQFIYESFMTLGPVYRLCFQVTKLNVVGIVLNIDVLFMCVNMWLFDDGCNCNQHYNIRVYG